MTTVETLVELIRKTSSTLPDDVLAALRRAARRESASSCARVALRTMLQNCEESQNRVVPLCQDTGALTFFVPRRLQGKVTRKRVEEAVRRATALGLLRKNCLDPLSGASHDDNCALGFPVIHYIDEPTSRVTLLMKGGGSENMSRQYSLPDATLNAGRDVEGVRRCVLDAVQKIQGYGCAPGILGVCVGGDRAMGFAVAKEQLLRPLVEESGKVEKCGDGLKSGKVEEWKSASGGVEELERRLLKEANELGIGPMGLGGKTTLLGVKMAFCARVPASFFVTVAYMCWACRRQSVEVR